MTTLLETFPGSVGVGTNDPGSYRFNLTGGTSSFQALEVNNLKVGSSVNAYIPVGGIVLWSGSIASIPSGWVLCDGTNSTPDLRDRFIIGAGSSYAVDGTGGSNNSTMGVSELPSHTHGGTTAQSGVHSHTANTSSDASHTHNATTSQSSNHTHGYTYQQGGNHSHPYAMQQNNWHSHSTYYASAGGGQWNNMAGGWRNAFTGINGYKQSWGPNWGSNGSGNHGHNTAVNNAGSHNHNNSVSNSANHTHNTSTNSAGGHTHTLQVANSSTHTHNFTTQGTGQGQAFDVTPLYYALAYIMKT